MGSSISPLPHTNGLAELAVQTMKRGLKKETEGSMTTRLAKVLLAYRTTPHSTSLLRSYCKDDKKSNSAGFAQAKRGGECRAPSKTAETRS